MLVLRAGVVFDGEVVRPGHEVVVGDDGRVLEVRPVQPAPDGATVVDHGPGTSLLPGLVDGHQHLAWGCTPDPPDGLPADPAVQREQVLANARRALAAGVTTVQDLGDSGYSVVEARDAVRGDLALPRILAAGPPVTTPDGHCHFLVGAETAPGDVVEAVRRRVERGVDVVKVMTSGGNVTPGSLPWESQYDEATIRRLVAAAHDAGLPVAAHAHGAAALADCVAAGVDSVEHCTFMTADGVEHDPELIAALAASGIVVRVTPGVVPGGPPPPPAMAARMPLVVRGIVGLVEAGARVVVSTDAGIGPGKPHDVMPYALVQFGAAVGDPLLTLRAGTSRAADALRLGGTCGRLAAGRDADVLVVRGDVTADLSALLETEAIYRAGQRVVAG